MILTKRVQHSLFTAVLLAYVVCYATVAEAGITISPVVLEVISPRKAVAVTVTNNGDRPITLQTETMLWKQVNGADQEEPTDDLLVTPPIITVPAKGKQVFRVILRAPTPSSLERSYRLVLEDISEDLAPSGPAAVAFKLKHSLPVMVAPSSKVVNVVRWKPCATEAASSITPAKPPADNAGEACVRLINAGNRRVKVQTLTLTGDGWQQALVLKTGENVLVGAEREWRVPLQHGQTGTPRSVQVLTALGETLTAETDEGSKDVLPAAGADHP